MQLYMHDHSFNAEVPKFGATPNGDRIESEWEWTTSGAHTNLNEDERESKDADEITPNLNQTDPKKKRNSFVQGKNQNNTQWDVILAVNYSDPNQLNKSQRKSSPTNVVASLLEQQEHLQ